MTEREFLKELKAIAPKFTWSIGKQPMWLHGIRANRKKGKKTNECLCPIEAVAVAKRLRTIDYETSAEALGLTKPAMAKIIMSADAEFPHVLSLRKRLLKAVGL